MGLAALALLACGRVNFDLTERARLTADGGATTDATARDSGQALDGGSTMDGSPSDGSSASDSGAGPAATVCEEETCSCTLGESCSVVCYSEPCGVHCVGDAQCSAYCWSGITCGAGHDDTSATGSAPSRRSS